MERLLEKQSAIKEQNENLRKARETALTELMLVLDAQIDLQLRKVMPSMTEGVYQRKAEEAQLGVVSAKNACTDLDISQAEIEDFRKEWLKKKETKVEPM